VARAIYGRFLETLLEETRKLRIGSPDDPKTQMGPMASARRIEAMERITKDAVDRGARIEMGGKRLDRPGFYWAPTILTNVKPESKVLHEEPFGPILTVAPFDTVEQAIAEANATEYGLASYFFTNTPEIQRRMIRGLSAGAVSVNYLKGVSADAPNAGVNQSGYGYEGGVEGLRSFQNLKLVNSTEPVGIT
jgi:succinate-semialdehyde dehydrogenase/glutarate-semialdehyde dehydrogenase